MHVIDQSPALKRGEVKGILIQTASRMLPGFEFLGYKSNCYTFQRVRTVGDIPVYEALHIVFFLKGGGFACSIASRLNPSLIFVPAYSGGFINPHGDLKAIKFNSGVIPAEEAYYLHNGQVETTTRTIQEIFDDYVKFGLPFLDRQYDRVQGHPVVREGIAYVRGLTIDRETLQREIVAYGYVISDIKHPVYVELKERMQAVPGQSREDRKEIPRMAYDLLAWYFDNKEK